MKKGFTLIELLAVITILAIIALIIVPVTLNLVKKSKIKSLETSAYGLIDSAEYYKSSALLNKTKKYPKTFESSNNYDGLEIKGEKKDGIVKIHKDGKIAVALYDNNNCAYKSKDEDEVTVEEGVDKDACINKLIVPICVFKSGTIYDCDVNDEETKEFYLVEETSDTSIFMLTTNLDDNVYTWSETDAKIKSLNTDWSNVKVSIPTSDNVSRISSEYNCWTKSTPNSSVIEINSQYNPVITPRSNIFDDVIASPVVPEPTDCTCVKIVGDNYWACIDGPNSSKNRYPIRPTIIVSKSLVKTSVNNT